MTENPSLIKESVFLDSDGSNEITADLQDVMTEEGMELALPWLFEESV